MTTPKDKYRALCLNEASMPLFARDWWLDATAGPHDWDVAVVEKGGQVVAALPYSCKTRFGLKLLGQPALTPALGRGLHRAGRGPPAQDRPQPTAPTPRC